MRLTCRRFGSDGDRLPFSTLQQHSLAADDLNIQVYNIIYFLSYLSFFSFLSFFPFVIDGQFATWKAAPSGFSSIILFGFGYLLRSTCRTKAISGCHFYLYVPSPLLSFSLLLISLQFFFFVFLFHFVVRFLIWAELNFTGFFNFELKQISPKKKKLKERKRRSLDGPVATSSELGHADTPFQRSRSCR